MSHHRHLSPGYFAQQRHGDMAAQPGALEPARTQASSGAATVTFTQGEEVRVETPHDMLPGKAYEEMTVAQLRDIARERGVTYKGLAKPALIKRLRA